MNRLVYSVFKAIMMAIIFVFVFDMAFYLYRAISLNSRMQSISTSLQKVVMENNYLPSETATMYQHLFGQLVVDFNGGSYTVSNGNLSFNDSDSSDNFISGLHWNYKKDATNVSTANDAKATVYRYRNSSFVEQQIDLVVKKMNQPADYGQVMVVQIRVGVYQPLWGWGTANGKYEYNGEDGTQWVRNSTGASTEFVYNYHVPCLQYRTTNQDS